MHWTQDFQEEVGNAIVRMGMTECLICGSDQFGVSKYPVIVPRGGLPGTELEDDETNIEYLVRTECPSCGNLQFFNSARFRTGDEAVLAGPAD